MHTQVLFYTMRCMNKPNKTEENKLYSLALLYTIKYQLQTPTHTHTDKSYSTQYDA